MRIIVCYFVEINWFFSFFLRRNKLSYIFRAVLPAGVFGFCQKLSDLWKFRIFLFRNWLLVSLNWKCLFALNIVKYMCTTSNSSQVDLVRLTGIKIKKPSRVFIVMWLGHPVWTLLISRWESFPTSIFSSFHGISAISLCGIWI